MKQLSGTDSLFISMETPEVHAHIGGLVLLDTRAATGFSFERVGQTLAERLPLAGPELTSRLVESPLGLARPHLVPDPSFELDRHLHRIAVPSPGGMHELAELCGYLHGRKLDRRRPLWELWFIEGLRIDGSNDFAALYMKTHHALMDGMKGADLSVLLCDLEPNPAPTEPPAPLSVAAAAPTVVGQALEELSNVVSLPARIASYGLRAIGRGINVAPFVAKHRGQGVPGIVPRLSFNRELGPERGFACTSLPLADVKAVKDAAGVKLNDVAIEICATAMRTYAERRGETVDGDLAVTCPVSTRTAADTSEGNKISSMVVSCPTTLDDPVARLQAVHENASKAKELARRLRETPLPSMGDVVPPLLANLGFRALGGLAETAGTLPANATVSNVPGPPVQLYVASAKVHRIFPISVLAPTQGLNFTAVSFVDRFDIGVTVDPELVPDPWLLAECIDDAFGELRAAYLQPEEARERSARTKRRPAAAREAATIRSIAAA